MRLKIIILLLAWSFCESSVGQELIWKDIFLEDETNLNTLETDTIGFIWGLSRNGFFQYDGFSLVNKISQHGGSSNFTAVCKDSQQNFLIGTSTGEMLEYNPYSDKIASTYTSRFEAPITFIDCENANNNCLKLSYGTGIHWISQELDTFLSTDNILISNEVYSAVRHTDQIILATDQGIQIITAEASNLSSKILNEKDGLGDIIISNLIAGNNKLYASSYDSQIYAIDLPSYNITTFNLPNKGKINALKLFDNEQLIICTNIGIYTLKNNSWIGTSLKDRRENILDVTIDEENNIWACSSRNKISKANLGFQYIPNDIEKAQCILKAKDDFWIGSQDGLFVVNGLQKKKMLDNNITCLKRKGEDILVGTYSNGIIIVNKDGQKVGTIDGWEDTPNQSVLYIYPKDDFLYISSLTGVSRIRLLLQDGRYYTKDYKNLNDLMGPGYVYQIMEDNGIFYFGTDRQGLKILRNDSLQHITHFDNGHTLGSIYSLTKCDEGRMWFASSTGFIGYEKDGKVTKIDNERFLQDPYTSLITSADQKIVMVRNGSIDVFDPATEHFMYFNDVNPSSDAALYLNSFTQEAKDIYLAKPNGFLKIRGLENRKIYPEAIINKVMVNLIEIDGQNTFFENENNLEFKYSAAWMTDPERITYQYKLEGFEDNWRKSRDQRAFYPMLRPGKYTFRIKASIDGNFYHNNEGTYCFRIKQSFYKSWWFIALMLLLFGSIIRRWRNERRKTKLQKEDLNRKRIEAQLISLQTQLNPHFLFNSFNTLIGLIEENPSKGITFTEKLTDFYRSILELGKNDLITLKEEARLLETYIHLLEERFGEQLDIQLNWKDVDGYVIPPLALQLLIENAVKHNVVSTKNPLQITLTQEADIITISNPIQIKYGVKKGTGIGLENIKKRYSLNNLRPPLVEQNDEIFKVTVYLKQK